MRRGIGFARGTLDIENKKSACSPLVGGHFLHASDLREPLISGLGRIKVSKPLATRQDLSA